MKVLEQAIEKVKQLPEDRQVLAAELLEHVVAAGGSVFRVPEDHRAAIAEGVEQARRGEFASDTAVDALLRRPWA